MSRKKTRQLLKLHKGKKKEGFSPSFFLFPYFDLGFAKNETTRPQITDAIMPTEPAVKGHDKAPIRPFSLPAFLVPSARRLPKPVSGTVAPAPAHSFKGS